jgi:hypothetical protein
MIRFKLPEELTTFDYNKLVKETEIIKGHQYYKPVCYLSLLHTKLDQTKVNVPVISAGNLSCIQGKAKARKTFFLVLASSMILSQKDLNIVIFDTEQFQYHSSLTLWRINQLTPENKLRYFNLRKYSIDVRLEFVENYILNEKPEIIFLDNIRDCMQDINSWVETNKILTTFIQLADEYKTHICLTLHENPGTDNEKARGAIGTELQNKCETVFRLEKDKKNTEYTSIKGLFTRNMEFDSLEFKINDNGLPELVSDFDKKPEDAQGPF